LSIQIGRRYRSQVCKTEVIVVRSEAGDAALSCGGVDMTDAAVEPAPDVVPLENFSGGTELGKRYTDASGQFEVLVTKAGRGSLALDGQLLQIKPSKPLPSSD
jgi:hypothetical protein